MVEIDLAIQAPDRKALYHLLLTRLPEAPEIRLLAFRHLERHHGAYRGRVRLPAFWATKLTLWSVH